MANAVAITGAGGGIGRAVALRMARHGWAVAVGDIDGGAAESVAHDIQSAGGRALAHVIDVTDYAAVGDWVETVDDQLDGLTGAVANAGIVNIQPFLDLTPETWRRVLSVNVDGAFNFLQPVASRMSARGAGSIVVMASAASRFGSVGTNVYNVSKHALHGLTRCMALELGPRGVRVNAVSPGVVLGTSMWEAIDRERARILGKQPGQVVEETIQRIPLGRASTPDDIANLVAYLLCDESDYMTGQNVSYDGGFVMP